MHPRCVRDAPEMHPRCTRDAPEVRPRYTRDTPEIHPTGAASGAASLKVGLAREHLQRGNLPSAVREVRQLRGAPAATCAGWLEAAEENLLLTQALTAVKAQAAIAAAAMS